ncbi:hypothetical protein AV521_15510 [Streptomyces sp. IMTB 2501]|uniref:hypothetical protein n=1 Tax=Streptomyces sp. IMTB 2501 TaxID=1776340 RepID=UPI00096F8565|nr:hypothetical protein [Streptomyces sp. IMTB 2501]OLZ70524.1 hypothetical protein AV521_15510 [Streptomyces sp. IMTB 2501]
MRRVARLSLEPGPRDLRRHLEAEETSMTGSGPWREHTSGSAYESRKGTVVRCTGCLSWGATAPRADRPIAADAPVGAATTTFVMIAAVMYGHTVGGGRPGGA